MSGPLNAATLTPRTAKVLLYQGDDQAAMDDLRGRIDRLAEKVKRLKALPETARTMGEVPEWQALAEEHNDLIDQAEVLEAEAEERAVVVLLKPLGRKQWRSLVAAHPPRKDHDGDEAIGVNEETFADPLVSASLLKPEFDTPADRDEFLDNLTSAQFELIYAHAFALNRSVGDGPKAGPSSKLSLS